MEKKINLVELLKDCPKGMELDCTVFDTKVLYQGLNKRIPTHPIVIQTKHGLEFELTQYGQIHNAVGSECVIFPKGKGSWKGFVPPCIFKDGDIVATNSGDWIAITKGGEKGKLIPIYCLFRYNIEFEAYCERKKEFVFNRLATEEEKQKLFQIIKNNGYKWNSETKTLEKLIEPKFKVGDRIRHKENNKGGIYEISEVYGDSYGIVGFTWVLYREHQDNYELAPKFDINTLKSFDKVLVRDTNEQVWVADFFSHKAVMQLGGYNFVCVGHYSYQCIPYDGNEHLCGTKNDCNEFYKTWE